MELAHGTQAPDEVIALQGGSARAQEISPSDSSGVFRRMHGRTARAFLPSLLSNYCFQSNDGKHIPGHPRKTRGEKT
jgi:hypothetical protein